MEEINISLVPLNTLLFAISAFLAYQCFDKKQKQRLSREEFETLLKLYFQHTRISGSQVEIAKQRLALQGKSHRSIQRYAARTIKLSHAMDLPGWDSRLATQHD